MRHGPDPIRGFLHVSGLPLTFACVALFSPKETHGLFIFYIMRAIYLKPTVTMQECQGTAHPGSQ